MLRKITVLVLFLALSVCRISATTAQWVQANGPFGGIVTSLAVSGNDIFAGTAAGGVFLSTNDGSSWSSVNTGLTNTTINALAVSGANVFAGTDGGAFVSRDRGAHWIAINSGLTDRRIESFTVSGSNIFSTTANSGAFVSTNAGMTWDSTHAGLFHFGVNGFASTDSLIFSYAWNDSLALDPISFSADHGNTWTVTDGIGSYIFRGIAAIGKTLIGFAYTLGTLRSTDYGRHWSGLSDLTLSGNFRSFAQKGARIIVGTDDGAYVSIDSGAIWTKLSIGASPYLGVRALAVSGAKLFAGTDEGAFFSTDDGITWSEVNYGIANSEVRALAVSDTNIVAGIHLAGIGQHRGWMSSDKGASWSDWNASVPSVGISALHVREHNLLAATDSGVFHSRDNGHSWLRLSDSLNFDTRGIFAFAQSDSFLFAATAGVRVLRSTDDGITWNVVFRPASYGIQSIAATGANVCIAAPMIEVSSDNGLRWTETTNPQGANVIISNGSDLFAGGFGGFRSTDGGSTWVERSSGLTDSNVTALYSYGSNLFAGTRSGQIFMSANNGTTWSFVGHGLTTAAITKFASDGKSLIAGTAGASVWHRPLSEIISASAVLTARASSVQLRAFPNPVTRSTTIGFATNSKDDVEVYIANSLGVKVSRLFSGSLSAGEHSFVWTDAAAFADGIYECIVRLNGRVESLPLVLTH